MAASREGKCVCQFGIGLVCGSRNVRPHRRRKAPSGGQTVDPRVPLRYECSAGRYPDAPPRGRRHERVLVRRAAVSLVCKRGYAFHPAGKRWLFAFTDGEQVSVKRIGQRIQTVRVTGTVRQPAQQQTEYAQLVKTARPAVRKREPAPRCRKAAHPRGKPACICHKAADNSQNHLPPAVAANTAHNLTINRNTQRLVHLHQPGQIPPSCVR